MSTWVIHHTIAALLMQIVQRESEICTATLAMMVMRMHQHAANTLPQVHLECAGSLLARKLIIIIIIRDAF
jgi:hypothetical protein